MKREHLFYLDIIYLSQLTIGGIVRALSFNYIKRYYLHKKTFRPRKKVLYDILNKIEFTNEHAGHCQYLSGRYRPSVNRVTKYKLSNIFRWYIEECFMKDWHAKRFYSRYFQKAFVKNQRSALSEPRSPTLTRLQNLTTDTIEVHRLNSISNVLYKARKLHTLCCQLDTFANKTLYLNYV